MKNEYRVRTTSSLLFPILLEKNSKSAGWYGYCDFPSEDDMDAAFHAILKYRMEKMKRAK